MSTTLCPLPWVSLAVRNTGEARVCCFANTAEGRGRLQSHGKPVVFNGRNLPEIRNHSFMQEIRKTMLEGQWHSACVRCEREEAAGVRSKRQYSAEQFPSWIAALKHTDPSGKMDLEQIPLLEADLRFGNKCNLACRMCGPQDSSLWYRDYVEFFGPTFFDQDQKLEINVSAEGRATVTTDLYSWHEDPRIWEQFVLENRCLRKLYIVGGEAFLVRAHQELLERLIREGLSKNIVLEYNSNLTVLPDALLKLWKSFKWVKIGISLDAVGNLNDYIRHPSRFHLIDKNIAKLAKYQPGNVEYWIACTVSVYNLLHMPDLLLWALSHSGLLSSARARYPVAAHFVHRPHALSIRGLPERLTKEIEGVFEKGKESLKELFGNPKCQRGTSDLHRAEKQLDQILSFMRSSDEKRKLTPFWMFTEKLDALRGENFKAVQPFAAEILSRETYV